MIQPLKNQSRNKILKKKKFKDFIRKQLWQHILVVAFICFCAWLFNKYYEAVMFCIAHVVIRKDFAKQYHSKSRYICMSITLSVIFFGIMWCMPVKVSLLSSIFVAFVICLAGYLIQDRIDLLIYKKKTMSFNLKTCTKDELIEKCKLLEYSSDKIELAVMFFCDKLSNKQVWKYMCSHQLNVDIDTVRQYRYRMKKDLNKFMQE